MISVAQHRRGEECDKNKEFLTKSQSTRTFDESDLDTRIYIFDWSLTNNEMKQLAALR